jgi:hypothetical protein
VAPDDPAFAAEVLRGLQMLVESPLAARRAFGRYESSALVRIRRTLARAPGAPPIVAALLALLDATMPPSP